MRQEVVEELVARRFREGFPEQWDSKGLREEFKSIFDVGRARG